MSTVDTMNKKQKKRERLRVGDPDFESPDGGWAWLILVACGISNLLSFPIFQQYGLVFKEKFNTLGISSTEVVTIINTCIAFNTGAGLLNGPVFKRFTSRKVGIFSAILLVGCLIMCAFCRTFWMFIIFFSIGYGGSFGLLESANALAMNTYFDKKRRVATGLSWTITALGPVVCPYIVIALLSRYGMEGTILLFSGVAMHSLVCSLLLQPVHWHTRFRDNITDQAFRPRQGSDKLSRISSAIFQSQYLENDAGAFTSESPMMLVDSNMSLTLEHDSRPRNRSNSNQKHPIHQFSEQTQRKPSVLQLPLEENLENTNGKVDGIEMKETDSMLNCVEAPPSVGFWQQIIRDFDFALLKDPVYVNLMLGLTMTNFVELNFGLLTPVIMAELNFQHSQIATFMSLLAGFDILFRFLVSFVADKVKISNRNFYLLGIVVMMIGRTVFMHTHTYTMSLIAAAIIGSGKALRTIFLILVIPSHVPLERLPAAYGLQYAFSLLFFVIGGPIAGWIRQTVGNYIIQIHMLNILTYVTIVSWLMEGRISTYLLNKKRKTYETDQT